MPPVCWDLWQTWQQAAAGTHTHMASIHTFCMLLSQPGTGFRDYLGSHQINTELHTVKKVLGKSRHWISRWHHQTTMTLSISQRKSQVWISKFLRDEVGIVILRNQNWPWQAFILLRTRHRCKTQPCFFHSQSHLKHNHDNLTLTISTTGRKTPTTANSPCWEAVWEVPEQQHRASLGAAALPWDPSRLWHVMGYHGSVLQCWKHSPDPVVMNNRGKGCQYIKHKVF